MQQIYNLEMRLSRQEDGLWRAEVPALQDCWVDSPTVRQALGDIQEVAAMAMDVELENDMPASSLGAVTDEVVEFRLPIVIEEHWFRRLPKKSPGALTKGFSVSEQPRPKA